MMWIWMKPAGTKPVPRLDGTEVLMTPSKFISFLPFDICLHLRWLWKFLWCHALLVNLWYVGTQLSVGFQSFIKSQFPCFSPLIFIRILDGGKNVLMASWTLGESIWLSRARRTHFITAWPVKRDERPLKHFHAQRIGAQSDFAHRHSAFFGILQKVKSGAGRRCKEVLETLSNTPRWIRRKNSTFLLRKVGLNA